MQKFFILIGVCFLIISLFIFLIGEILELYKKKKRNYLAFDREHPVGSHFITKLGNQLFPYGKWELIGLNQDEEYVFERLK